MWLNEKSPKFPDTADCGFAGLCVRFLLSNCNLILPVTHSPAACTPLHTAMTGGLKKLLCLWESLPQLVPEMLPLADTHIWQLHTTINLPQSKTEVLWQRSKLRLKHVSTAMKYPAVADELQYEWTGSQSGCQAVYY